MQSIGIIGLPNAGKSTLFNALAHTRVEVKKHPFTTIEPNVGMVRVPDPRLDQLVRLFQPERVVPASVKFMDIAGLVKGAGQGEGLGNQFLAAIRSATALAHVVRCFESEDVSHVMGELDPVRDIEVVHLELMLSDLEVVEKRLEKIRKGKRSDPHQDEALEEILETIKGYLERSEEWRGTEIADRAQILLPDMSLLSLKPMIYIANLGESDLEEESPHFPVLKEKAEEEGAGIIALCGKLEEEIINLPEEDRADFRQALGIRESGLASLARAAKELLGLITFFTKEGVEVRAWMVKEGTTARQAAGSIHTDMEKGFIRAEVVSFGDLVAAGSLTEVKQQGHLRFEGRDYRVEEGDVIRFLFKNVSGA